MIYSFCITTFGILLYGKFGLQMNELKLSDKQYMARCLQLARCGFGSTSPNPMVGAVIVHEGRIIGEGYHVRSGEPHAEVNAVNSVSLSERHLLRESTIYVTLEPCSHYGKTAPCCDLIISCGIPRVVIGVADSNAQVNGRGISKMRDAGIDVVVGVLEEECYRLNQAFFTSHEKRRPWVTLKWAQSADGYIDLLREAGKPVCVSTNLSRVAVHKLRAGHDAILVGTRTALLDNPSLDIRYWAGRAPLRLVIDREGVLPTSLRMFNDEQPTVVYTAEKRMRCFGKKVEQVVFDFEKDVVPQILEHLHSLKVNSLLVEGGACLLQSFIDSGFWDVARVEVNNSLFLGQGVHAPSLGSAICAEKRRFGGNEIVSYLPKRQFKF